MIQVFCQRIKNLYRDPRPASKALGFLFAGLLVDYLASDCSITILLKAIINIIKYWNLALRGFDSSNTALIFFIVGALMPIGGTLGTLRQEEKDKNLVIGFAYFLCGSVLDRGFTIARLVLVIYILVSTFHLEKYKEMNTKWMIGLCVLCVSVIFRL